MSRYTDAVKLQEELAPRVITKDTIKKIQNVCAVDVSYKNKTAKAAAVIMDVKTLQVLEFKVSKSHVKAPYVPGLMMLRESGPVLSVLKLVKNKFDVLLVDGNGQLHPRRCGLACYLGIKLDMPTIGVAKSLLCGKMTGDSVRIDGKTLAKILEKRKGKRIFVSIGHKISLKSAVKLVNSLIREGEWLPESLRLADRYSKGIE